MTKINIQSTQNENKYTKYKEYAQNIYQIQNYLQKKTKYTEENKYMYMKFKQNNTCINSQANKRLKQRQNHNASKQIWIFKYIQNAFLLDFNHLCF